MGTSHRATTTAGATTDVILPPVDVLVCPRCAGPRRIVGAVTEPHAVRRLLAALGLAPESPPGIPLGARA